MNQPIERRDQPADSQSGNSQDRRPKPSLPAAMPAAAGSEDDLFRDPFADFAPSGR